MNSPVVMLAVGVAVGVLLGTQLKQCAAAPAASHATGNDIWAGLVKLGGTVVDHYFSDDEDKR